MFDSFAVLQTGNKKQQNANRAIQTLGIRKDLAEYHPVLCGTIPLAIDVDDSDLDIIMEVNDFDGYTDTICNLYQDKNGFRIKELEIRGRKVVKSNFHYLGFDFELFGQNQPVKEQHAFLHMMIEFELLQMHPTLQEEVIRLKKQGIKTEPAFCQILGIEGDDPYKDLIVYGKKLGLNW